jgi:hypothetical protein
LVQISDMFHNKIDAEQAAAELPLSRNKKAIL